MNVVKEIRVTESFIGLSLGVKQCQNEEAYSDCETKAYLSALIDNCKCLPFDLKYFNDSNIPICNSSQLTCAERAKNLENKCIVKCEGLVVTSYSYQNKSNALDTFSDLIESYKKYKGIIDLPGKISKLRIVVQMLHRCGSTCLTVCLSQVFKGFKYTLLFQTFAIRKDASYFTSFLDLAWNNNQLRYVRIYFDSPTFDRITKDRSAKFVDMLSAIGGTMGLLTGFSIISGVEIIYFVCKIIFKK